MSKREMVMAVVLGTVILIGLPVVVYSMATHLGAFPCGWDATSIICSGR